MSKKYIGRTLAYKRFHSAIWKTQSLLQLGVVGIDEKVQKDYSILLKKFEHVKGIPGPKPKNYTPQVESKKTDDGHVELSVDPRTALFIKKAIEADKKRHDELRFFLYSNIFVSVWGAFETYNQMLFEELLLKKPEMLKSKETIPLEDIIQYREKIVEHLVERQIEIIGHFKIDELTAYYKKKVNLNLDKVQLEKIKEYYLVRNIIAHKSGIVRSSQIPKLPAGIKVVGDEIQIPEPYLNRMIESIEKTVTEIEKHINCKFYNTPAS